MGQNIVLDTVQRDLGPISEAGGAGLGPGRLFELS